jgi:hypothetical protein
MLIQRHRQPQQPQQPQQSQQPQQPQQPQQLQQPQQIDLSRQPAPPIIYEDWAYGFDDYVERVDYIINERWAKLSCSKQYNKAWDATELVNKEISKIAQLVTIRSSTDSKINALLGLNNIAGIVAVGGDCIGSEVRKHVGYDDVLVNTMLDIINLMTVAEKRIVTRDDMDAFEALDEERKGYCVFDGFEQVLEKLTEGVVDLPTTTHIVVDNDDDDDYGDVDEQAMLNTSDAIEGSASQPIEL